MPDSAALGDYDFAFCLRFLTSLHGSSIVRLRRGIVKISPMGNVSTEENANEMIFVAVKNPGQIETVECLGQGNLD